LSGYAPAGPSAGPSASGRPEPTAPEQANRNPRSLLRRWRH